MFGTFISWPLEKTGRYRKLATKGVFAIVHARLLKNIYFRCKYKKSYSKIEKFVIAYDFYAYFVIILSFFITWI